MVAIESGNCSSICEAEGLACNPVMKLNRMELEKKADITCSSSSEHSKPYHPTVVEGLEPKLYDCYGVENINPEVKCDANSPAAEKRICDCVSRGIRVIFLREFYIDIDIESLEGSAVSYIKKRMKQVSMF